MIVEIAYAHLEKRAGESVHFERIPRFRISLLISNQRANGWSAEELCRQYPNLRPSEVYSALAYYHDHMEETDAEIKADLEEFEKARGAATPTPWELRMRAEGRL